jgi:hypothetical protein
MWFQLLSGREQLLDRVLGNEPLGSTFWRLLVVMIAGAALYGAALGSWHGARLAAYDALKLPLVLMFTSAFTVFFSWVASRALGMSLRFAQVAVLTFIGLATAAVLLASLTPIAWFFTWCAPVPDSAARTTHNELYLFHTVFVAMCGVGGSHTLWRAVLRLPHPRGVVATAYVLWVLAYAVVGGEVAWALRPFVGSVSPEHPLVFLRADALNGNVYEFIGTDIAPYLWSR